MGIITVLVIFIPEAYLNFDKAEKDKEELLAKRMGVTLEK